MRASVVAVAAITVLIMLFGLVSVVSATELPVLSDLFYLSGKAAANVGIVGGGGAFTFAGNAIGWSDSPVEDPTQELCGVTGVKTYPPLPIPKPDGSCGVTANGTFTNIVCGTGSASGTASFTGGGGDGEAPVTFTINFVAGQGILTGTSSEGDGTDLWVGLVELLKNPQSNLPTTCVLGFQIDAVAAAVESPI